jgi:hypothetical protein
MEKSSDTTFETSDNIAWRNINEEVVILNLKSGEYFTLNDVGQVIWLAITDKNNIEEIRQKVVDNFDVSPENAAKDIDKFLTGMLNEGLLHESVYNQKPEGG